MWYKRYQDKMWGQHMQKYSKFNMWLNTPPWYLTQVKRITCIITCIVNVAVLPIQCKGVVELHVRMCHGVEGRKLLQSLHQLHDGLVILDDKRGTCWWAPQALSPRSSPYSWLAAPPSSKRAPRLIKATGASESLWCLSIHSVRVNCLLNTKHTSVIAPTPSSHFFFLVLPFAYIVTIPKECWIIQHVLDACCSNESFMRFECCLWWVGGPGWWVPSQCGDWGVEREQYLRWADQTRCLELSTGSLRSASVSKIRCRRTGDADRMLPRQRPLSDSYSSFICQGQGTWASARRSSGLCR